MPFSDLAPDELSETAEELRKYSEDARPDEINNDDPPSLKAYRGEYWDGETWDSGAMQMQVNESYGMWMSFLPVLLGRMPKPACAGRKDMGDRAANELYARCINKLTEYSDDRFRHRQQAVDALFDAFHRGTGFNRHEWDHDAGIARTRYFDARNVFPDHNAKCWEECNHIIERHVMLRGQAANLMGWPSAKQLKKMGDTKDVKTPERLKVEDTSPYDVVCYYLLWSKDLDAEGNPENRVIPFSPDVKDAFLWEGPDGKVGDPFPFPLGDGKWHLTDLRLNKETNKLWGFSMYEACKGPMQGVQWAWSWIMAASGKSSKQFLALPKDFEEMIGQIQSFKSHLPIITYDPAMLEDQAKPIKDFFAAISVGGDLPQTLIDMLARAEEKLGSLSGYNAVAQLSPQGVDTATEASTLRDAAANRVGDMQRTVEDFTVRCIKTRHAVNADKMIKPAMVCIKALGMAPTPEGPVGNADENLMPEKEKYLFLPYRDAALLQKGVSKTLSDYMQSQGGQGAVPGAVEVRRRLKIDEKAKVEIKQPGAAFYLGDQLAQAWIENATDAEVDAAVDVKVEVGSASATSKMERSTNVQRIAGLILPVFQQYGMTDKVAACLTAIIDSSEEEALEPCRTVPGEIDQSIAKQQEQAAQQAQQEAQAQAQAAEASRGANADQAAAENRQTELQIALQNAENENAQINQGTESIRNDREEMRGARDRSKDQMQLMMAGVG